MPAPLDESTRNAIEQAIRAGAGKVSCRGIAKQFDVSPGTVRNIAKRADLDGAFGREQTKAATEARTVDMAARRAALAARALDLAERMLDRAGSAYTVLVATREDVERVELAEPPAADVKHFAASYGLFVDRHMSLIKFDTKEASNPAATSLVDRLAEQLGLAATTADGYDDGYLQPEPPTADDSADTS
jgi:hypothetical protein